ncbi:MAG: hypothetical protein JST36_04370 [Bacteroidetes bacterium]|nr:hypothetical protein [Bacteroidota bacterium]
MKNRNTLILLAIGLGLWCLNVGCYYDKANELYPSGQCDTSNVSFSKDIMPVVQSECAISNCHVAPNPPSGGDFSQYEGLKIVAIDGRLLGAIQHQAAYSPMPQNAAMLSDCTLSKFKIWVAAGAPKN